MKVSGRKMKATIEIIEPALVELLGAQVGDLLVQQRGPLAHRLQLLGHAGEAIGRLDDVQPVVLREPVEVELGQRAQRVAVGRDEAAEADRLRAHRGDLAAQPVELRGLEVAFDLVERVAEAGDLGIELGR